MCVCVCVFERDREEHTRSQNETILDTTDRRTIWIYSVVFLFIFSPKWHSCLFHHNFCLFYLFVAGHWLVTHLYLTHLINLNSVPQTYCLLIFYEFWPLSYICSQIEYSQFTQQMHTIKRLFDYIRIFYKLETRGI